MISVRAATAEDAPTLFALLNAFVAEIPPAAIRTTVRGLRAALAASPQLVHAGLAERDGVAIGFVTFTLDYMLWLDSRIARIDDLYVTREGRGGGAARRLMRHVADIATAAGIPARWEMEIDNPPARRLYEGLGAVARDKTIFSWSLEAMQRSG